MAKIIVNNPRQVINGGAKKYYFKVKGLGGPKGDKGDKGDTGSQGPQGPQGNAATISVGSTTTLPVGYDATVENVGTIYNAVLNFGIPQGPRGPQGATGATGAKGDKGDQGNPGPQGEKGTNATVYIGTTTTGEPGTQASVYNSGTASNAVLNFTIPRGDVGPMPTIAQSTGQATDQVMSQKATTDAIANETSSRQNADIGLQSQIDAITSKSDVVDVVANYAALQAYDTQHLGDNDVIKVLDDETHGDALTYYRWSKTNETWTFIGQEAPYYSKSQTDTLLLAKQNTIDSSHKLSADLVDDTSTTNKFVTAQDITNWNGKQDALTAGTGIDITGGVISTPAIVPEVVTELPTIGAEGKLYLTPKAHTTSTATGNPIEATITAQAGQLESFQLDGDTYQQTYTGKNLFNSAVYVSVLGYNAQRTLGNDGSITWVNTASDSYFPWIYSDSMFGNSQIRSATIPVQPSTQYTVSLKKTTATAIGLYIYEGDSDYVGIKNTYTTIRGDASYTFTTSETTRYAILRFAKWASQETDVLSEIQLEVGSTATTWEKFVGGEPSPNPSYPQPIQTVTGLQTVEIHGKNLLRYPYTGGTVGKNLTWTVADDGTIHAVGTIGGGNKSYYLYNRSKSDFDMPEIPAGTYKVFWSITGSGSSPRITIQDANGYHNSNASNEVTIATSAKPTNIYIQFIVSQSGDVDLYIKPMIVPSDQADVYAPYSHQTLPLDLGNIELCKLGTYQDYIWKDGDSWKVHKDVGKYQFNGAEPWVRSGATTSDTFVAVIASTLQDYLKVKDRTTLKSPCFIQHDPVSTASGQMDAYNGATTAPVSFALSFDAASITNITDAATWISNNKPTVYSAINDPTDTVITDQALIAQLEAIRTASLENGTNTITNTATGTNLAGDMEIGYFGFNPTNRYDKFIWLDLNNNYEQIGGE